MTEKMTSEEADAISVMTLHKPEQNVQEGVMTHFVASGGGTLPSKPFRITLSFKPPTKDPLVESSIHSREGETTTLEGDGSILPVDEPSYIDEKKWTMKAAKRTILDKLLEVMVENVTLKERIAELKNDVVEYSRKIDELNENMINNQTTDIVESASEQCSDGEYDSVSSVRPVETEDNKTEDIHVDEYKDATFLSEIALETQVLEQLDQIQSILSVGSDMLVNGENSPDAQENDSNCHTDLVIKAELDQTHSYMVSVDGDNTGCDVINNERMGNNKPTASEQFGQIISEVKQENPIQTVQDHSYYQMESINYSCSICKKIFRRMSWLNKHMQTHNSTSNTQRHHSPKACRQTQKLANNEQKHYNCPTCNKSFGGKLNLRRHIETHSDDRPHCCDQCGTCFKTRNSLIKHMYIHREDSPFICHICNKAFKRRDWLTGHMYIHDRVGTSFECSQCDKVYRHKSTLKEHERKHTGELPHPCTTCDKRFNTAKLLKLHTRHVHIKERRYPCKLCDQRFVTSFLAKQHEIRMHTDTASLVQCHICGKNVKYLSTHMVQHREKRFKCADCGKLFALMSILRQHQIKHATVLPFSCPTCGKAMTKRNDLLKHMRTHTGEKPYQCLTCERRFALMSTLTSHMKIHKEKKILTCDHCDKTFTRKGALAQHVKSHSSEKPFGCSVCAQTFSTLSGAKTHIKFKHLDGKKLP